MLVVPCYKLGGTKRGGGGAISTGIPSHGPGLGFFSHSLAAMIFCFVTGPEQWRRQLLMEWNHEPNLFFFFLKLLSWAFGYSDEKLMHTMTCCSK